MGGLQGAWERAVAGGGGEVVEVEARGALKLFRRVFFSVSMILMFRRRVDFSAVRAFISACKSESESEEVCVAV